MSDISNFFTGKVIVAVVIAVALLGALYTWKDDASAFIASSLKTQSESTISNVNDVSRKYRYPAITVKSRYIEMGKTFNPMDNVTATDADTGADLTDKVNIYGTVNVNKMGLYVLKYTVTSTHGLKTEKTVNIIVK